MVQVRGGGGRGRRLPGGAGIAPVLAEIAQFPGQFGQALADARRPVTLGEVVLDAVLDLARDALHLLLRLGPRPRLRLLGLVAGPLGLLTGPAALVLGAAGLLLPLLLDPAHLLLGGPPGLLVGEVAVVPGRSRARLRAPAGLGRGRAHLAAQVTGRAAHVGPYLGGQLRDRLADLQLQVRQLAAAVGQFGATRVRDGVHLAAALRGVPDQALGLQLGQAGVDRARRGGVQPLEAFFKEPDHFVAVARGLVEQLEQIQAQASVGEDGGHVRAPSCRSCRRPGRYRGAVGIRRARRPPRCPPRPRAADGAAGRSNRRPWWRGVCPCPRRDGR